MGNAFAFRYGRASRIILNGVDAALRNREKPRERHISDTFAPACAQCESDLLIELARICGRAGVIDPSDRTGFSKDCHPPLARPTSAFRRSPALSGYA
jgi:hypothetical protein